jgi:hypothetical protein
VRAFTEGTAFRCVVLIPMHPNGDYIHAMKSKCVLHYQVTVSLSGLNCQQCCCVSQFTACLIFSLFLFSCPLPRFTFLSLLPRFKYHHSSPPPQANTISKCATSILSTLRRSCPGIVVENYLTFHSLRNWGVLNKKVYSEQVYIHDKLLIVDDR